MTAWSTSHLNFGRYTRTITLSAPDRLTFDVGSKNYGLTIQLSNCVILRSCALDLCDHDLHNLRLIHRGPSILRTGPTKPPNAISVYCTSAYQALPVTFNPSYHRRRGHVQYAITQRDLHCRDYKTACAIRNRYLCDVRCTTIQLYGYSIEKTLS
ncbi:hypothetical protein P153DRAFT_189317 [Dothidotthia symphoricarpi CBS 119687]|uniref:Uncharacterized protein n=1 Tax=Dothidotthia symphoricarpi CBS 119687 TaxID=1392245 RepID=A0A6A6AN81_9PLEO|nr:uncharacterized protein P153DRAFT_189317 [Dothidotthia symphoricarpi CBS 119687]KAF2132347.1 hypothetical protein P153DRAFT_189317 [Dothidotthia symphoricarpi CBS 119687]